MPDDAGHDLEIAVATMGQRDPEPVLAAMGLLDAPLPVLLINQVPDGPVPAPVERGRVRMRSFAERGIARSRNRALEHGRTDLMLLADDDVRCLSESWPQVRRAFAAHPRAAAITFRCRDSDTGELARAYPRLPTRHTALSVASVMSVEIGLRRSRLMGARFDERFGLGSRFPSGEEAVFLRDLQRAGGEVRYAPVTVCTHPGLSSGYEPWALDAARAKGAVLRRMYPGTWPLLLSYLAAAKYGHHGRGLGPAGFVGAMFEGARQL